MQWNSLGKSREKRTSPLRLWPTVSIVPDLGTGPARRYRELYGSSLGSDRPPRGPRYPIRASRDWSDGTRTPTTPFREHIALEHCSDVLRLLPMRLHVAFHELENQVLNGVLAARHGGGRSLWGRDPRRLDSPAGDQCAVTEVREAFWPGPGRCSDLSALRPVRFFARAFA